MAPCKGVEKKLRESVINRIRRFGKFEYFIFCIVGIKLLAMGLFSSDYQNLMFIPFVDHFITYFDNPWEYYFNNDLLRSFPYPPLMLYIVSIGGIFVKLFSGMPLFIKNILFKLPNLVFDLMGLYYFIKLYPFKRKYVAFFYFTSPIIIYASYMHGQLDIIPTALLVGAIYYFSSNLRNHRLLGVLFLAAALSAKLHILAAVPIIFLYLQKKFGFKHAAISTGIPIIITAAIMVPFLSEGFINTVLFNNEQNVLSEVFFLLKNQKLYIPILALMFVYMVALRPVTINKDLLLSICGLLFSVFLALVPPMPGWYVWIVPFISIFLIDSGESRIKNIVVYAFLNIFYLIYFISFHRTSYVDIYFLNYSADILKVDNKDAQNLIYTILTGLLMITIALMYHFGIASNSLYKYKKHPFAIGISGDSGSGKNTISDLINNIFVSQILQIEGDSDHKWVRNDDNWRVYTHLNPKANHLYRQAEDIKALKNGGKVNRVNYDHNSGTFSSAQKVSPKNYIILCGLHSFYLPQMRKLIDLKIYMDTDEVLRRYWKINRDVAHRSYSKEKVLAQIEDRLQDSQKYIVPQREYADLIVNYYDDSLKDCLAENWNSHISLKITVSASINLEPLLYQLSKRGVNIYHDYSEDLKYQYVDFDGNGLKKIKLNFDSIAAQIVPNIDEITTAKIKWSSGLEGILQVVILLLVSSKMKDEV